ncbi:MAG TPA: transporter substrate-binding domain-containing protein, partial [Clostridia bacterium]|nr:transporter substrate-binding domain-containing protein [Clostridia bacterium]
MEVSFVSVDLSSMLKKFDAGKADAVIGDFPAGGSKNVLYTRPYLKCGQVIVVNSGSTIQNKNGLVGKAVGVLAGSAAAKVLSRDDIVLKIKDRAPVNYYDYISAFMDLDASKLDAIALDETAGRYYVSQKETQYRLLGDRFPDSEEYAVAVRRNDGRLRNQIQDAMNQMTKDGTTAQISKKWFGEDLTIH